MHPCTGAWHACTPVLATPGARGVAKKKKKSQITPTPKGMGLSARKSGGGGAAQGHPSQSSSAGSTTATPLRGSRVLVRCCCQHPCALLLADSTVKGMPYMPGGDLKPVGSARPRREDPMRSAACDNIFYNRKGTNRGQPLQRQSARSQEASTLIATNTAVGAIPV